MSDTIRRMDIRVEIDRWEWPAGNKKDTLDVTPDIMNYRFQKTIKNPQGSCQLAVLPQSADTHILDILSLMDVIRIYEFGTLKFLGFITRVSYQGSINASDGKPLRTATLTCQQFGGLLVTANVGLGLGTALGLESDGLIDAAAALSKAILDASIDGVTFAEMITVLIIAFEDYLTAIDATKFLTYIDTYLDISSGLTSSLAPAIPRTFELFNGTEQTLTFWQLAEQLVQKPFNEFWIDNGPRKVSIDSKDVTLPEKACLVFRETPFNGTKTNGVIGNAFDSLPVKRIDKDHLIQFDLAKSMDEVYTFYSVKQPAFELSDLARLLLGQAEVDKPLVGKYLFRPLITELFYTRVEDIVGEERDITQGAAETISKEAAITLLNWFTDNENYLSGAITHMVPSNADDDPAIGDKISVYGIDGFFYVEGIAHTWQYRGALKSNLTVTRGFNRTKPIELKDRIFRRNAIS